MGGQAWLQLLWVGLGDYGDYVLTPALAAVLECSMHKRRRSKVKGNEV